MKTNPIESAIAEAERLFADAEKANDNWRHFDDIKARTPPWWPVGLECVWTLIGPDDEFWTSLRPSNYREHAIPVLTELARRVFDHFLQPYQKRIGQVCTAESFRREFADYVVTELLSRVSERVLTSSSAPEPLTCQEAALDIPLTETEIPTTSSSKDQNQIAGPAQRPTPDPFATADQREQAITRAVDTLGGPKGVAAACEVDYHDLRKWARKRNLAKGHSVKVDRIEKTLLQYCSSS